MRERGEGRQQDEAPARDRPPPQGQMSARGLVASVQRRAGNRAAAAYAQAIRQRMDSVGPATVTVQRDDNDALDQQEPTTVVDPQAPVAGMPGDDGQPSSRERATGRGRITGAAQQTPGDENFRAEWGRTATTTDDLDQAVTTETQAGVQVGRGGPQASATRTRTTDHGSGVSTERSQSGSVDLEGQAGYTRSTRRGAEGEQRTSTVGGTAALGDTGIEGATITAGRSTQDGRRVSFSAGYTVDISRPQAEADGRWSVSGKITYTISGTGGVQSQGDTRRAGGSGTLSGSREERFSRRFPTETAARNFYDDNTALFGLAQLRAFGGADSDNIDDLAVGESVGETDQGSVGVTGTASASYLQASVSFTISGSVAVDVERISETEAKATVRSVAGYDLGAALSTLGVGVGLTGGESEIVGAVIIYRIDQAAGRAALDRLLDTETLPEGDRGPGWHVRERITAGEERRSGVSANVFVGGSSQSTTTVEHVENEQGEQTVRATGNRRDTVGTVLPDWLDEALGMSGSQTVELQSTSGEGLSLSFRIDATNAAASNRQLAAAIGEGYTSEVSGEDAGEWRLGTNLSETRFRELVRQVAANTAAVRTARAWLLTQADRGADLQQRVSNAGSLDACRVLFADFVADLGVAGAGYIRRVVGDLQWSVRVVGSQTFTGTEGRDQARTELRRLSARLRQGGAQGVVGDLESLLSRERRQLTRIDSEGQELPARLRAQEHGAQSDLVAEIRTVLLAARRAVAQQGQQTAEEEEEELAQAGADPLSQTSGAGPQESSVELHDARLAAIRRQRAQRERARAALDGDLSRMRAKGLEQRRARGPLVHERALHEHGVGGWDGASAPRGWLETPILGGEGSTYERIDSRWEQAEQHRTRGEELAARAQDIASALGEDSGESAASAPQVDEARRLAWRAKDEFHRALGLWRQIAADYRGLRRRNPDTDAFEVVPFGEDRRSYRVTL